MVLSFSPRPSHTLLLFVPSFIFWQFLSVSVCWWECWHTFVISEPSPSEASSGLTASERECRQ